MVTLRHWGGGDSTLIFVKLVFEIAVAQQTRTRNLTFEGVVGPPVPAVQSRPILVQFWLNYAKTNIFDAILVDYGLLVFISRFVEQLYIDSENLKWKNSKALGISVKSILRLSLTEIWAILLIFGSFFALVFTFQLILSYGLRRTCSLGLLFIFS